MAMESQKKKKPQMLMTEKETYDFYYETFCQQDFYDYYDYYDEEVRPMESEDNMKLQMLMTDKETERFHYMIFIMKLKTSMIIMMKKCGPISLNLFQKLKRKEKLHRRSWMLFVNYNSP